MRGVQLAPLCHLVPERALVTGYCGTCRVRFTTLTEWESHQHPVVYPVAQRRFGVHVCPECGDGFGSAHGMEVHRGHMHRQAWRIA
jgi:hypothetical protein